MPAKTEKQKRFFALCANNPSKAKKPCPPKKVAREFLHHTVENAHKKPKWL